MIENRQQLSSSLHYAAKWADVLEGLRLSAAEAGTDVAVLTTALSGPLSEVRRVLAEAHEFLERLNAPSDYHLPALENREKAA